jgi:hypothetical protein
VRWASAPALAPPTSPYPLRPLGRRGIQYFFRPSLQRSGKTANPVGVVKRIDRIQLPLRFFQARVLGAIPSHDSPSLPLLLQQISSKKLHPRSFRPRLARWFAGAQRLTRSATLRALCAPDPPLLSGRDRAFPEHFNQPIASSGDSRHPAIGFWQFCSRRICPDVLTRKRGSNLTLGIHRRAQLGAESGNPEWYESQNFCIDKPEAGAGSERSNEDGLLRSSASSLVIRAIVRAYAGLLGRRLR